MNYRKYIQSSKWKEKSKDFILKATKCERCGTGYNLTCHHKNYKNLGYETKKDIMVLCWNCHKKYHEIEKKRIKVARLEEQLKKAKENYKIYVNKTNKINQMKNDFLRKGKIKGFSKTKSKKLMRLWGK